MVDSKRIATLDGFRGLCILSVIFFHYFTRFTLDYSGTDYFPYHDKFANLFLFRYGYLGVHCFFIISGFVIFMTLQKCPDIKTFAIKRFIRIWPTLFICTIITFLAVRFNPISEIKSQLHYFLCSLTISDPIIWTDFFKFKSMFYIDGVEWSLVCEVIFYVTASIIYFTNKQHFFGNWLIYTAITMATAFILKQDDAWYNPYITAFLQPAYTCFFTVGIYLFNLYSNVKMSLRAHLAVSLLFAIQLVLFQKPAEIVYLISFVVLFMIFIYKCNWINIISARPVRYIGQISFTLYLLHNNWGIVLINSFSNMLGSASAFVIIPPALIIIFISSMITEQMVHQYINPYLKAWFHKRNYRPVPVKKA